MWCLCLIKPHFWATKPPLKPPWQNSQIILILIIISLPKSGIMETLLRVSLRRNFWVHKGKKTLENHHFKAFFKISLWEIHKFYNFSKNLPNFKIFCYNFSLTKIYKEKKISKKPATLSKEELQRKKNALISRLSTYNLNCVSIGLVNYGEQFEVSGKYKQTDGTEIEIFGYITLYNTGTLTPQGKYVHIIKPLLVGIWWA